MRPIMISKFFRLAAVLFSGICYYFGFSLQGNMGWLIWIAPIPIFYISLRVKPRQAFLLAFLAYLIGRLSWFPYLLVVAPTPVAILFTFLLPLIFALIVVAARRINLLAEHPFSAIAFPILFTAFEYGVFLLSRDGTAASIAYTQSNYLPLIQIASVTGILGISFLLTFFPSAIALAWYQKEQKKEFIPLLGLSVALVAAVLIFGRLRLKQAETGQPLQIGMAVIDESAYRGVYDRDSAKEMELTRLYLQESRRLADQGAKIILLPEKAIIVNNNTRDSVLKKFTRLATDRQVQIIIGGTNWQDGFYLNNAWVISDQGKLLADYQKVNLFEGEILDGCRPGNKIAIYKSDTLNEGVAICKDMDFQQFIMGYSKKSPAVLFVPAWDFVQDGWLHSRMAILRGVEGGFSIARNARQGRLTLSDWRGKVLFEANSESGKRIILSGQLPASFHPTIYTRAGDWFGMVSLLAACGCLFYLFQRRKSSIQ